MVPFEFNRQVTAAGLEPINLCAGIHLVYIASVTIQIRVGYRNPELDPETAVAKKKLVFNWKKPVAVQGSLWGRGGSC